jgi:hypothetical protein
MDAKMLRSRFARMGARVEVGTLSKNEFRSSDRPLTLDIRTDQEGECFAVRLRPGAAIDLDVVDLRRREQHLLLRARVAQTKHFYLCGHDEQHWFVAAIPERVGAVQNVFEAMEALKPPEVLEAQRRQGLKGKHLRRRKNAAYVRQGEWFFLPVPRLRVEKKQILFNEPLSRGRGSKPHWAEFLYRTGGESVYVCSEYPEGVRPDVYRNLLRERPRAKTWNWRLMQRNPMAYVKGQIRHSDHKTIGLQVWHRVLMNTESESQAMRHVVFLD